MKSVRFALECTILLLGLAIISFVVWAKLSPGRSRPTAADMERARSKHVGFEQHPNIAIFAWNVESGGSDPATIAGQLKYFIYMDIFCLSEVDPEAQATYLAAIDSIDVRDFKSIDGKSGRSDRLQIIYDAGKLELLESAELTTYRDHSLNDGNHRSPLVALFKVNGSGHRFYVVQNHLARGNEEVRNKQAIGLREWSRDKSVDTAVVVIGDLNFDFDFRAGKGNAAFAELARDNVLQWVRPIALIDTNWADRHGDGKDDYPDSMLDGAYVAGPAKDWRPTCEVVIQTADFPDDEKTSDHRPIQMTLQLSPRRPGVVEDPLKPQRKASTSRAIDAGAEF